MFDSRLCVVPKITSSFSAFSYNVLGASLFLTPTHTVAWTLMNSEKLEKNAVWMTQTMSTLTIIQVPKHKGPFREVILWDFFVSSIQDPRSCVSISSHSWHTMCMSLSNMYISLEYYIDVISGKVLLLGQK